VEIATPDHWHAALVIAACRAGKDIYCQKPLSLTVREGRAMANAVKRYGVVFQTGSQQRSDYNFRRAAELVLNGRIGRLHTVECGLPGGWPDYGKTAARKQPEPVPEGFDYDMWLGPAPYAPYCPARVGVNFRWVLDYSGGQLTDWGGHHPDCAQWGMGTQYTGPIEIRAAKGTFPVDQVYNTATEYYFEAIYKNGVKLIISNRLRGGVTFRGTEGWVWANRGRHDAEPKSRLRAFAQGAGRPGGGGPSVDHHLSPGQHCHAARDRRFQVGPGQRTDHRQSRGRPTARPRISRALGIRQRDVGVIEL